MTSRLAEAWHALAEPPPVTVVNEGGSSPCVLICEHASNYIPQEYDGLGLPPQELERHIAWDIGAADLALRLSACIDAPLFLSGYSRLLIDLNRPLWAPTSIPVISEATPIPGNHALTQAERSRRTVALFDPFHERITRFLDHRMASNLPTVVIGVHSFTPVFLGTRRPWHAGVLYRDAVTFGSGLITRLSTGDGLLVGDNEPYRIEPAEDYTVPVHGDARGINAVLVEVRQDLLETEQGKKEWASRLVGALADVLTWCGTASGSPALPNERT